MEMLEEGAPKYIRDRQLPEKVAQIMNNKKLRVSQRHPRILGFIRDVKYDLSEPWKVSNMEFDAFSKLFVEAIEADKEQAKVLNSLSFNIIRSIQAVKKDYEDRMADATSTIAPRKIIVITGTTIAASEQTQIKEELAGVKGRSSEFSIQIVSLFDGAKDPLQQGLDDFKSGDADIYDSTPVNADKLLTNGPERTLLIKLLYSHLGSVDKMKLKDHQMYGDKPCSPASGKTILPSIDLVRDALAINQDHTTSG